MRRIVSGMRPTGRLHLGHYHGTLENWVTLQDTYDCFYFVADWHALTTKYDDVEGIVEDGREMVVDWIASGLDPARSCIYRQSDVPEVAELFVYLSMITPVSWLERNPTYKEVMQEMTEKDIANAGFLSYPVLQASDIILPGGEFVPVGEDQLPHLELTREIVRRFNYLYGDFFAEPQAILSPVKKMLGIDGRKMSKSYGNSIYLADAADEIVSKVKRMITDPARVRRTDPGDPADCQVVYPMHRIYSEEALPEIEAGCKDASLGCIACKERLAGSISGALEGFRAKRAELERDAGLVDEVLAEGARKVRAIAMHTMEEVRSLAGIAKVKAVR
ncbi:MAG: tryptophan--tRNA ligase [Candidatus Aquicultorales bacterium]